MRFKECKHCGHEVDDEYEGKCPNCHQIGYVFFRKVTQTIRHTDHVSVEKTSRLEQIKKNPSQILLSLGLFTITVFLGQIEHPLTIIFQIITGIYAVALTPINEIRKQKES